MPAKNVYVDNKLHQQMAQVDANWSAIVTAAWKKHIDETISKTPDDNRLPRDRDTTFFTHEGQNK